MYFGCAPCAMSRLAYVCRLCRYRHNRHTCALRLANDPQLAITDVQSHLRHKHLSSTETYLTARSEDVIRRVQGHGDVARTEATPAGAPRWAYEPRDLDVLLGGPEGHA
jgi:hypothetical protein